VREKGGRDGGKVGGREEMVRGGEGRDAGTEF